MLISEMQEVVRDQDVIDIINEKPFSRFARTTSITNVPVCVFVGAKQYVKTIPDNATMVITTKEIAGEIQQSSYGLCISSNPKATYFRFFKMASSDSNQKRTVYGQNCKIGSMVSISDYNVEIGNNVVIEDFVTIYENVKIGDNCIIRSGVRLGVQDYNYFNDDDELIHLPHFGNLVIENNVEVGFNSVIGKSLYPGDSTIIGEGSKLANCCAVGHDCILGKRVMIYAGTMIAGYVSVGDDTHITLNSTIKNGISIGKNVQIDMGSVVLRDIPDGETVFGNPARKVVAPK